MATDKVHLRIDISTATTAEQAAANLRTFAAVLKANASVGACPPHGTDRCENCGHLPVIRIWTDRAGALWDEHPGELISRRDHPDGGDQEIPLSDVTDTLGPLKILWHADDACPPGCTLPWRNS